MLPVTERLNLLAVIINYKEMREHDWYYLRNIYKFLAEQKNQIFGKDEKKFNLLNKRDDT